MSEHTAAQSARGIEELSRDKRFSPRANELEALSRDLRDPDGDAWAGVDLFAAFPPEASIRLRHRNVIERIVGAMAALSVFLPVGWTWLEFHRASSAYEQMIASGGEPEGRTFLGLWASGFDGRLDSANHLAPMAFVSVSLIVFAIVMIVAHRLIADASVRREERAFHEARTDLVKFLTAAALVMNARRADHPQRIEGIIKSSMDKLRQTQDAARKAVLELSETSENVNTGVQELLDSVQSARTETETLLSQARSTHEALETVTARTGEALTSSISSLDMTVKAGVDATRTSVNDSVAALEVVLSETVQATRDNVDASAEELSRRLVEALATFQQTLSDRVDTLTGQTVTAIDASGKGLIRVIDRIGESTSLTAGAADSLAVQVSSMRDDNVAARQDLERAMEDLRGTLDAIEMALSRHESTLQGHASELTGARDAAERMLRQLTSAVVVGATSDSVRLDTRS